MLEGKTKFTDGNILEEVMANVDYEPISLHLTPHTMVGNNDKMKYGSDGFEPMEEIEEDQSKYPWMIYY